ncbi:hypothetical protein GQ600_12946 [Phytophthora cactorum]|nr:hypothetical protein GQ600_12946 [Phytophthora cactorum]
MQLIKGLIFAAIATLCLTSTDATSTATEVKANVPKPRKLWYIRTRSPYNRNNTPQPTPAHLNVGT